MKTKKRKDPAAIALGRKGGKARVANQTAEERSASARHAAIEGWKQRRAEQKKGKS